VRVFVTGGTGYLGRALVPELLRRGHDLRLLVRPTAVVTVPPGAEMVVGDALRAETFAGTIPPADTVVHLVGTPKPSPAKAAQFRAVDLTSVEAAVAPMYAVLSMIPSTRDGAARLGLVTRRQIVSALVRSVERPPEGLRIVDVPEIRAARL